MSNIRLTAFRDPVFDAAIIGCVQAAAEASDRLNPRAEPTPYVRRHEPTAAAPAIRYASLSAFADSCTPHERALFRALSESFEPAKCIEMVLRARLAAPNA